MNFSRYILNSSESSQLKFLRFFFLKNVNHIILGADYMKKNQLVNRVGLRTKTNCSLVVLQLFYLWRGDELFEIHFEFKRKQPTKMPQIFFLKNVKHIILGADYMKRTSLLTGLVFLPRQIAAWWYYDFYISGEG